MEQCELGPFDFQEPVAETKKPALQQDGLWNGTLVTDAGGARQ
jgi:hypothetical protein